MAKCGGTIILRASRTELAAVGMDAYETCGGIDQRLVSARASRSLMRVAKAQLAL